MSLLDDVSIVVTPNGYKAGELYAVIPVPTEGSEKILNTDFATDSNWTPLGGWSISGGSANCNGGSIMYTNASIIATKIYKITYTVSGFVSGGVKVRINGSPDVDGLTRTSNGTFTEYITSSSSPNGNFSFAAVVSFVGSIDNVSVKEYTAADMDVTRATAATRVDENGLVNYAEIIGGEEVVDGDFPSGTTAWSFGGGWSLGVDSAEATSGSTGKITQTNTLNGKYAQVTLTLSNYGGAGLILVDYGSTASAYITSNGTHTLYGTYDQNNFEIYKTVDFSGTITNISVKEVTRDNVPRIDYTGGGCPHILAEPQRTNEYKESTNIDNWTFSNATGTSNYSVSPDGTQNASRLLFSGSGYAFRGLAQLSGVEYTVSVYAKRNDSGTQSFGFFVNGSGAIDSQLNITSEWKRFTYTYTTTNTYETGLAGDSGADISFYGYQKEQGSYATSLIPTSGSAVTRNQDIFTRDGIGSLINSTEGVLFVEMASFGVGSATQYISITNGVNSSYGLRILYHTNGSVYFQKYVNGTRTTNLATSSITITDFNKLAIRYNSTTVDVWANGVEILTNADTNAISSGTLNRFGFDIGDELNPFFGKVKQLQVYDTSLSDTQLAALTS